MKQRTCYAKDLPERFQIASTREGGIVTLKAERHPLGMIVGVPKMEVLLRPLQRVRIVEGGAT